MHVEILNAKGSFTRFHEQSVRLALKRLRGMKMGVSKWCYSL